MPIERVLDHRPPEQGRRHRVFALDQLRCRIEQEVQVPVDLRRPRHHELRGAGLVWPFPEEVESRREAAEPERVLHGPVICLDVLEGRQPLEVGTQVRGGEPFLERRSAKPLRLLLLARCVECLDVDLLPRAVGAIPGKIQVIIIPCADGTPLRPGGF